MGVRRPNIVVFLVLVSVFAAAQGTSSPDPKTTSANNDAGNPPPKKAKKIWTEDNVKDAKGNINSEVGTAPTAGSGVGEKPSNPDPSSPESSAQETKTDTTVKKPKIDMSCPSMRQAAVVNKMASDVLRVMGVEYWHEQLFYGSFCNNALTLAQLAQKLQGDHSIDNKTSFTLNVKYRIDDFRNMRSSSDTDPMVQYTSEYVKAYSEHRIVLIEWKSKIWILVGGSCYHVKYTPYYGCDYFELRNISTDEIEVYNPPKCN